MRGAGADIFLDTESMAGLSAMSTPTKGLSHPLQRPLSSRCLARSPAGLAHVEEGANRKELPYLTSSQGGKVSNVMLAACNLSVLIFFQCAHCCPCILCSAACGCQM